MKRSIITLFIMGVSVITLNGCSTTTTRIHYNGHTEQEYYSDKIACQKMATRYVGPSISGGKYTGYMYDGAGEEVDKNMALDCLRSKGYGVSYHQN